jgi:hypothetical protein
MVTNSDAAPRESSGAPIISLAVTFSIDFDLIVTYNPYGAWSRHFVSHKVFLPPAPFAAAFMFRVRGLGFSRCTVPAVHLRCCSSKENEHQGAGET